MKQKSKNKIILLTLSVFIILLTATSINNPINNDTQTIESDQPETIIKPSYITRSPIHIDNNWSATKIAGICTGSGTYGDPYVIEDYEINGEGLDFCIDIKYSNVYFIIKDCFVYNTKGGGFDNAGIFLFLVYNSQIINNDCSNNNENGIGLVQSDNNTVSGNTANNNGMGIHLFNSNYNTITGNTANNNGMGIHLLNSNYNTITGNTLIDNDFYCVRGDDDCVGNVIENNDCGEEEPPEEPDNLWIILLIISVCVIVAFVAIAEKMNWNLYPG